MDSDQQVEALASKVINLTMNERSQSAMCPLAEAILQNGDDPIPNDSPNSKEEGELDEDDESKTKFIGN